VGWTNDQEVISLADARHRMANVFQLLSTVGRLRATRTSDAEAKAKIAWMLEAIGAIAVVQRHLLTPGGDDFAAVLHDMAPGWRRQAGARPVTIELAAEPTVTSEQVAPALALIAQELVANAVAHAFPDGRMGVVRVELTRQDEGRAVLAVTDDGVGYDPDGVDGGRLGLWLIKGLTDQVQGVMDTRCDSGVCARLEFPLA
jgi:two-component sensor histidine kinase